MIQLRYSLAALALGCASSVTSTPEVRQGSFVSLFDGRTLQGWVTRGGHYDGNAVWTVEDGAITGRQSPSGEGGLIYTERPYTDFVLKLDAKLSNPFDSGIFLRMAPVGKGAQVTLDLRPDGEIGAIYSDGFLLHNESGKARFRDGEWNHFELRCTGKDMELDVTMNGELLVHFVMPPGSAGYAPTGLIGLQVHGERDDPPGSRAQFKNIEIRELAPTETATFVDDAKGFRTLTPWGRAQGWTELFNGRDLGGWECVGGARTGASGFAVVDGLLVVETDGASDYIRSERSFRDFQLALDFKIASMANSGLFLRGARNGDNPAYSGCEVQILDDFNWERVTATKLEPWQFTGSLYGAVPPRTRDALKPLGEWNRYEITFRGSTLTTILNGRELYSVDTLAIPAKPPFTERAKQGFIGLQRHAAEHVDGAAYAWFRNVFVREL